MKKQHTIFSMLLLSMGICNAQSSLGPKLTAMGQNSAAVTDAWNVSGNPAFISNLEIPTFVLNYVKYLVSNELSTQAVGLILPLKKQTLGFCTQRYGILPYHELKVSSILAKEFGDQFSIGLRINFHQLKIDNYGATTGLSFDVGAYYKLTDQAVVGAYINNPAFQKYNRDLVQTTIPSTIYFGLCYLDSDKITIACTVSKEWRFAFDVGLGFDYRLMDFISLRAGLTAKPFKQYIGFGFNNKKLTVDLAVQSDPLLAYTPQIGIAYAF